MAAPARTSRFPLHVVDTGVGLALVLVVVRARTIGWGLGFFDEVFVELPKVLAGATYDVLFASALTAAFLALHAAPLARRPRVRLALGVAFHAAVVATVLACLANVTVVEMLGKPFTYQWLYYSDFLASADARAAIAESSSARSSLIALACSAAPVLLGSLAGALFRLATRSWSRARAAWTLGLALGVWLWLGHWYLVTQKWPSAKVSNPLAVFVESWARSFSKPVLHSLETPYDGSDFAAAGSASSAPRGGIRDVVVFVLESVGAGYLDVFGGEHAAAPTLARLAPRAALFERVWAHMPGTNPSLASLHASVHPWISFKTITAEHPDARLDSLSARLRAAGFRTAYFSSASLDFQGAREFLAHQGYDLVQGPLERPGARHELRAEWEYLHGSSDADTVDALAAWLERDRADDERSFAMLWTLQAHYPYYVTGAAQDFGTGDPVFERYLNAVRESDAALGRLVDRLDARGASDSTLLVVVADHGEAFAQHGSFGHGSALYEENLRVPLLLVNARLFHGERRGELGGLVDVPPTILDCLGIAAPATWQGRSFFAAERTGRLYACAPWSGFQLGFREGDWKAILDTLEGEAEVYDLASDPGERVNLAAEHAEFVRYAEQRLASWVQHQAAFYAAVLR